MCFDDCVWSFEGSLGARTVHDKRPNGVAARTRAPNATHTDVRDTRVHQTPTYNSVFGPISRGQGCRGGSPDANADARQTLRTPMAGRQVRAKPYDYE